MVSLEALEAFKKSGLYDPISDPDGKKALTQFMNAQNAGKIDSKGMPVQAEGLNFGERPKTPTITDEGMGDFYAAGSEKQELTAGPVAGFTESGALDVPYGNDLNQSNVQITDPTEPGLVNVTVPESNVQKNENIFVNENVQPEYVHDETFGNASQQAGFGTRGSTPFEQYGGGNKDAGNSIDNQAQEAVNNAKKEVDITFKQDKPTTLFGMAAEGLDKSGFTDWSKEKMGQSFGYGMGQFGDIGKGQSFGQNIMSGLKGGAGMMGAAMSVPGSMLSGALGGLGSGLYAAGSALSGQQQPRYGQGQQRFPQTQYSNFG